ncbi:MAG: hypothetical protein WAM75_22555 [Xanthobacteraceae bacterium]
MSPGISLIDQSPLEVAMNPPPLLGKSLHELNPASWMYERIVKSIIEFEAKLSEEEEIGGRLVSAPSEGYFHIEDVSYWGPDMIIFHGTNQHGRRLELLQHYSQLSVLLTAIPKEKDHPRRIGFILEQKLESKDA